LHDRLRKEGDRFPAGINPSIQSIKDRFDLPNLPAGSRRQNLRMLFKLFSEKFDGDQNDLRLLERTLDLSQVGKMLTIYKEHQHAFYIAKHELNYGFHHGEMLLIALILRSKGKKYNRNLYRQYQALLPKKKKIQWMVFLYTLVSILYEYAPNARMNFEYRDGILYIHGDFAPYLARQEIEQTDKPKEINRIEIS
jgi:exopolyphosphatase/guanosine-5'-triphosphate,3'-diphosphate pyrophosphatase